MLALDEYGTRRVKQWMNHFIEPALRQLGRAIKEYSQTLYSAHKVFRIVQPSAIQDDKEVQINVPMYNDMGEAIGKWKDYGAAKFDIRIISGTTLPINRWAYLEELMKMFENGIIDDIEVLAESDIKNKEQVAKRKSMYSQMQGQISEQEESIKNKEGTIETLERQLVQAGIKNKIMQATTEVKKKQADDKKTKDKAVLDTQVEQKLLRGSMAKEFDLQKRELALQAKEGKANSKAK